MKNILLPTDFSPNASHAIAYAVALFKEEECTFYLLHTYEYDVQSIDAITVLEQNNALSARPKGESLKKMNHILDEVHLQHNNPKHNFSVITEQIELLDGIRKTITRVGIDLVIMGAKGTTQMDKNRYGKHIGKVIEGIRKCPVMVVPPDAKAEDHHNIIIIPDLEHDLQTAELRKLFDYIKNTTSSLRLLIMKSEKNLSTSQKTRVEELKTYLGNLYKGSLNVDYVSSKARIKDYINVHFEGIICFIDQKPSIFRSMGLTKSPLFKLGYLNKVPVLTLSE